MSVDGGVALGPGEGESLSLMGNKLTFKAVSGDTGGGYALLEYTAAVGFQGPPAHIHRAEGEAFYVLDGELEVKMGRETVRAPSSAFALVPRGMVHTFSNSGNTAARFLIIVSPGGLEKYFEELGEVASTHGYPPPPDRLAYLADKYNFEVVGPPPGS